MFRRSGWERTVTPGRLSPAQREVVVAEKKTNWTICLGSSNQSRSHHSVFGRRPQSAITRTLLWQVRSWTSGSSALAGRGHQLVHRLSLIRKARTLAGPVHPFTATCETRRETTCESTNQSRDVTNPNQEDLRRTMGEPCDTRSLQG